MIDSCTIRNTADWTPCGMAAWSSRSSIATVSAPVPVARMRSRSRSGCGRSRGSSESSARSMPSTDRTSSSEVLLVSLMFARAARACSGWVSIRWRPTPACTLIWLSEWAITSCSSRAMRTRSACSAVCRRCEARRRNSATRSRRVRMPSPMPKTSRMPRVVPARRHGVQGSWPISSAIVTAATQQTPTEIHAQSRAPADDRAHDGEGQREIGRPAVRSPTRDRRMRRGPSPRRRDPANAGLRSGREVRRERARC